MVIENRKCGNTLEASPDILYNMKKMHVYHPCSVLLRLSC